MKEESNEEASEINRKAEGTLTSFALYPYGGDAKISKAPRSIIEIH